MPKFIVTVEDSNGNDWGFGCYKMVKYNGEDETVAAVTKEEAKAVQFDTKEEAKHHIRLLERYEGLMWASFRVDEVNGLKNV